MIKNGICPACNQGPRDLKCRHPETKQWICLTCYRKATTMGTCPECKKEQRVLCYLHPKTKKPICHSCYARIKRRERGLRRVPGLPKKPTEPVALRKYRKNPYPTKKSVIEALKARARDGKKNNAAALYLEDASLYRKARKFEVELPETKHTRTKSTTEKRAKKPARLHRGYRMPAVVPSAVAEEDVEELERKAKYPTKEAVIAVLEGREMQGKENFPSVLQMEDTALYRSVQMFEVELPIKENPPVRYYLGDLVMNQNPKDPDIYGKIGRVVESSEKETRVNFKERGRITRVYRKWENLNNITLHIRCSSIIITLLVKTVKREALLV